VGAPLAPRALEEVRARVTEQADELVERLIAVETVDAVTDIAHFLPLSIVSNLVGIPEFGRENMLRWATASFDAMGPIGSRTAPSLSLLGEMTRFMQTDCTPDKLIPGGWAARIWEAVERGDLDPAEPPLLMNDYLGPSLDTTINATANLIWLLATNPDQWEFLRSRPDLVQNAINESLRAETVIQWFSRSVTRRLSVEGLQLPAGARVLVLYGSANRDERQFADPTRFDVTRPNAANHLALGHGRHACPGGHLARIEIRAVLEALLQRVRTIELLGETRVVNSVIRGFASLPVRLVPL